MGCASSSGRRQVGLRHDHFHNSIAPISSADDEGIWSVPTFQSDYRHSTDMSAFLSPMSAFLSPRAPVPDHQDPPPYTEHLLEGHVTLMYGSKSQRQDQDPNTSFLTARDVSILDRSTESTGYVVFPESPPVNHIFGDTAATPQHNAMETQDDEVSTAPAVSDVYSGINSELPSSGVVMLRASTPTSVAGPTTNISSNNNPFREFHSSPPEETSTAVHPFFQRPTRSASFDNSHTPAAGDNSRQAQSVAPGFTLPFQRPIRSASFDNSNTQTEDNSKQMASDLTLPFQQPIRSASFDNSSTPTVDERRQVAPGFTPPPFPRRPTPPPSLCTDGNEANQRTRAGEIPSVWSQNNPFYSRPARLPPLLGSSTGERQGQSRRRPKRKRVHSWHGKGTPSANGQALPQAPTITMSTVTE